MNMHFHDAYLVAATRTPVAKRNGMFRHMRPDDMLAHVLRTSCGALPQLDRNDIADVYVGCAIPEGEQGMNVARLGVLMAGLPECVPAITVNRFCS
jgi:acetyl-CoA acyltransferase